MSSEIAIRIDGVGKGFHAYNHPGERLTQLLRNGLHRLAPRWFSAARAPGFVALDHISFEVARGETVAIIGRNGSGKSTLLQIICGTLAPSSGAVTIQGRVAALLELGSGFNPEYTGRENIYFNAQLLGLSREEVTERFQDIVDFSGIAEFLDKPVKTYSSGMFVRLAFSVIAHVDADILIIDEALAVGDAFFTQKCMKFLREFMKTGTILFVSHDTGAVKALCSRAVWLEKGQMMADGPAKDVAEQYLQAFVEEQQGRTTRTVLKASELPVAAGARRDHRQDILAHSNLRNDLRVVEFSADAQGYGQGHATIENVAFLNLAGEPLAWVVGGEDVLLQVKVSVQHGLQAPIVGFYVKDRLGQYLFGDNTYLTYADHALSCAPGTELTATFQFQMPRLARGDYMVTVAVAAGTQDDHVQHHWIDDALHFRSESSDVAAGIIGIPMQDIQIKTSA